MRKKAIQKTPLELLEEFKPLFIDGKISEAVAKFAELEKEVRSRDEDVRLSVADHLKKNGWSVVLVSEHSVRSNAPDYHRYEYCMNFLGSEPEAEERKDVA